MMLSFRDDLLPRKPTPERSIRPRVLCVDYYSHHIVVMYLFCL